MDCVRFAKQLEELPFSKQPEALPVTTPRETDCVRFSKEREAFPFSKEREAFPDSCPASNGQNGRGGCNTDRTGLVRCYL